MKQLIDLFRFAPKVVKENCAACSGIGLVVNRWHVERCVACAGNGVIITEQHTIQGAA